ncbi:cytoskeletal protein RodZ [Sphingomonas jejuensis]|uniref:Cytoskeletal protein RodZ n=1 Tax=Sphingomonas jejuensis TaxID=904715 RepID=A0ABX0XQW6_9SPHN|nr:helix-turn-helix domain-containing protein [Sphingomonas jejuensis]NJC35169.1 cytoskeletal protein RodZ [Sphingomonas jejuensis]
MSDELNAVDAGGGATAGERLRQGRLAAGLELSDVATRTRIPLRHLEALESDDYGALPSPTYSTGFAKAYARAVGVDEVAIAADVRRAISLGGRERHEYVAFEPADPARTPPRLLAWTAAIIAVLLLVGYGVWRNLSLPTDAPPAAEVAAADPAADVAPAPAPAPQPQPPAGGQVVLTANDSVWLRVSDAAGGRLFERELSAGERYEVPADANGPRILTGRPQALTVTVGGREVAPLGPADRTVSNLPIDAASLTARATAAPGS